MIIFGCFYGNVDLLDQFEKCLWFVSRFISGLSCSIGPSSLGLDLVTTPQTLSLDTLGLGDLDYHTGRCFLTVEGKAVLLIFPPWESFQSHSGFLLTILTLEMSQDMDYDFKTDSLQAQSS